MDFREAIKKIKDELQKPLPGKEHQYIMAPDIRRLPRKKVARRKAAVMICLFEGMNDLQIAFIKRAEYDGPHSGQISFPGGIYKEDDHSLLDTALRETEEEIGIAQNHARILGALSPLHIPITNILVHPFVSFYEHEPVFRIDEKEVKYMIIGNLKSFLEPECRRKEKWFFSSREIHVPFFQLDGNRIWGATAMMLSEFISVITRAGIYT
jgi:8-oxo-dGTP pyrophosphatase MutT (NUDIX family)